MLYSLQKGGDSKRKDIFSTDSSFAPCAFNNKYKSSELLSLVCCKGARKNSKNNTGMRYKIGSTLQDKVNNRKAIVYLIGIHSDRIIYIAELSEILEMTEYYKYKNRLDLITRHFFKSL